MVMWNQKREGNKNKFLISYEMGTAMIPLLLCGTMIGVLLSKFLPPSVVCAGLVTYLLYSTYKMFFKAIEISKKENAEREMIKKKDTDMAFNQTQDRSQTNLEQQTQNTLAGSNKNILEHNPSNVLSDDVESGLQDDNDILTTFEMLKKQLCNFFLLICSYFFVLMVALLRGGEGKQSVIGLDKCSEESWLLL